MSRPANPYEHAGCNSFMRTLEREEIYANTYRDLGICAYIEEFIEDDDNPCWLRSAICRQSNSIRGTPSATHPAQQTVRVP